MNYARGNLATAIGDGVGRATYLGAKVISHAGSRDASVPALSSIDLLIEAVGYGSQPALKRLYELESRRLYGIALHIVRRPDIAHDVLQDVFLQIWQKAGQFSPERGSAAAWTTSIVRFRAIDAVRKLRREVLTDDPTLGDEAVQPDVLAKIDDEAAAGALHRCLKLLDDAQRRCIRLAFVEGFSHSEICKRVDLPLGTVKSRIRRALQALRGCLDP